MRRGRRPEIHHSDQGGAVRRHGVHRAAGRPVPGDQHGGRRQAGENGYAERMMGTIREEETRPATGLPGAVQLSWILNSRPNSRARHLRIALLELPRDGIIGARTRPVARPLAAIGFRRRSRCGPCRGGRNAGVRRWFADSSREDNRWAIRTHPTARPSRALGRPRPPAAAAPRTTSGRARPGSRTPRREMPEGVDPAKSPSGEPTIDVSDPAATTGRGGSPVRRGHPPRAGFSPDRKPWGR